jgi:hypothetical protein
MFNKRLDFDVQVHNVSRKYLGKIWDYINTFDEWIL